MTLKEYDIYHKPIMLDECIQALKIKADGIYVDCTTGGGGHASEILKRLGYEGTLVCFDKDDDAIKQAGRRFQELRHEAKCIFVKDDFKNLKVKLNELGIKKVNGILADLGVSSHQLDDSSRGFGYMKDGPLDMRMDKSNPISAQTIVNTYTEDELVRVIKDYGEERYAARIASVICRKRMTTPFRTTGQLTDAIFAAMPAKARNEQQHPAKRTFQALRIEVNDELGSIRQLMQDFPEVLDSSGRIAVISFHSLEDRIVKEKFKEYEASCVCSKELPVCVCNKKVLGHQLTNKPIVSEDSELEINPRARSAKLRVFEMN